MAVKAGRDKLRRSIFSAKQRRGQKESSIIQKNVSGSSIDNDMHCEHVEQNRSWEISKKKLLPPHWMLCS